MLFVNSNNAAIPASVDTVRTSGHTVPGLGAADYIADPGANAAYRAAHPASSFQAADGRGFRLVIDRQVNVREFGAIGDGAQDDTLAITRAIAAAQEIAAGGKVRPPVYLPSGEYIVGTTLDCTTGLVGDGSQGSTIKVAPSAKASFNNNAPLIRISTTSVPVRGFSLVGLAERKPVRSSDVGQIGFFGLGILFDADAGFTHMLDVTIRFFLKGVEHSCGAGHLGGTNLRISNCFYNLHFQVNAGDYRYVDCDFTGALFASIGCSGDADSIRPNIFNSGISGLLLLGCHLGFCPIAIWQDNGTGTLGLLNLTMINSSVEQIGNQIIRLGDRTAGQQRNSGGWNIVNSLHSWTDNPEYKISNEPNIADQDVCVNEIDVLEGYPIRLQIGGWRPGTSTYVAYISTALRQVHDDRGSHLWRVLSGRQFLSGLNGGYRASVPIGVKSASSEPDNYMTLATFAVPYECDQSYGVAVDIHANLENTQSATQHVELHYFVDNVDQGVAAYLSVPPGYTDLNVHVPMASPLPGRDRTPGQSQTLSVKIKHGSFNVLNVNTVPGTATLRISQDAGAVYQISPA